MDWEEQEHTLAWQRDQEIAGLKKTNAALRARVAELEETNRLFEAQRYEAEARATRAEAERDSALDKFRSKVEECILAKLERDEARARCEKMEKALRDVKRIADTPDVQAFRRIAQTTLAECEVKPTKKTASKAADVDDEEDMDGWF